MSTICHTHCCYCRRGFSETIPLLKKTKDHFIPKSKTGKDGDNILQCCFECNRWKADRMPDYWLKQVIYFHDKRKKYGTYKIIHYNQITGSVRRWIRFFKNATISEYKTKTTL